jgi:SAM-dependent methyltransferase
MKLCLSCRAVQQSWQWTCPTCGRTPAQQGGHYWFAPELAQSEGPFNAEAFRELSQLEGRNFWFTSRSRLISWALRKYFGAAESFLEVGCGTGFVLSCIAEARPGMRLAGGDLMAAGLTFTRKRLPNAFLFQADARRLPFREEFDLMGAFDVIEHIEQDEEALAEMREALRPGGGLILTVPQHRFLWSAYDELGHHKRRYSRRELVAKVARAGFEIVRVTSFVSILLPLMLANRLRRQRVPEDYDPVSELKIHSVSNAIFRHMLTVERCCIKMGLSLPVGGSLLLVARRLHEAATPALGKNAQRAA